MKKIQVKFYGIFKDYIKEDCEINVEDYFLISDLKKYFINNIFINDLNFLKKTFLNSNFSNNNYLLKEDYLIKNNDLIFILPPFSGG